MLDPKLCESRMEKLSKNRDLFSQSGDRSTIYIEAPIVSLHMEYR